MTVQTRIDPSAIETEILRASLRSRCRQAGGAFAAMILNTLFCTLLLGRGVNGWALAAWLLLLTGLLLIRYAIATRAARALDAPKAVLEKFDRHFRLISAASQFCTGAGIWIAWQARDEISAYVMTLLICLYATGTMVNLAHDYRSFRLTVPLLMLQPTLFWLLQGLEGLPIAVILPGLALLMISSVRNSQRSFDEGIRIRFEKDDLLEQLEREKQTALRALSAAEQANRSKSFFMAAASHDLRQPLYAAAILCDTLALHPLPPEASALLEKQRRALSAASGLFDNLLDLSRFESGTIEPAITPVHVRELLREIEAELSSVCAAKGIAFALDADEYVVRSDYDLLDRMVRNLVGNAVRYTSHGGVRIATEERGDTVLLAVEDTGIGIPAQDQERIFREFVQLNNPQRSRDQGVGLGLAIVRHISRLLSHEITVQSAPGRGTRICIVLPRASASAAAPVLVADAQESELDLSGRRVWIVEDDGIVRDALEAYFRQRLCTCECGTSRAALEQIERRTARLPDFAIVDDMLSAQESGLEVARWLATRVDPARILLMTGNVDPQRWDELVASGFAVLRKPILASALNEWLSRQAKSDQTEIPRLEDQLRTAVD